MNIPFCHSLILWILMDMFWCILSTPERGNDLTSVRCHNLIALYEGITCTCIMKSKWTFFSVSNWVKHVLQSKDSIRGYFFSILPFMLELFSRGKNKGKNISGKFQIAC